MWQLFRRCLAVLLRGGGVPRHVAFIMDGNRRFAVKEHLDRNDGHLRGYSKMVDVIHWCLEVGVPCITVYAFSIDNFKRTPEEVGNLMHLAEEKFSELMQDNGLAEREGVEVRVLGDLALPPESVQGAAARIMQNTVKLKHKRAVLNICFAYTSTHELYQAVRDTRTERFEQRLHQEDIDWPLLRECLLTRDSPPVDLMLRTSGETRLSDFLVWQCGCAQLCFVQRYWPDLTFFDFAKCIIQYQRASRHLQRLCSAVEQQRDSSVKTESEYCARAQSTSRSQPPLKIFSIAKRTARNGACSRQAQEVHPCSCGGAGDCQVDSLPSHLKRSSVGGSDSGKHIMSNILEQMYWLVASWLCYWLQLFLSTFRRLGLQPSIPPPTYVGTSIQQAYLKQRNNRLDEWIAAAASYPCNAKEL